jgi:hypothetical protein
VVVDAIPTPEFYRKILWRQEIVSVRGRAGMGGNAGMPGSVAWRVVQEMVQGRAGDLWH